jgi:3',5'-nucleoside bisphosphate phosphatase
MAAFEAIELIHHSGGVAVLAHPGLYRADHIIAEIAEGGLDGLECWHTRHTAEGASTYRKIAESLGLAATGGSDCHGMAKGEPLIGRVRLSEADFTELKQRRQARRKPPAPAATN